MLSGFNSRACLGGGAEDSKRARVSRVTPRRRACSESLSMLGESFVLVIRTRTRAACATFCWSCVRVCVRERGKREQKVSAVFGPDGCTPDTHGQHADASARARLHEHVSDNAGTR